MPLSNIVRVSRHITYVGKGDVENSLGLSLKIRICYRNRRRVVVTLREGQRSVSEIQLSGAQLDRTNTGDFNTKGKSTSDKLFTVAAFKLNQGVTTTKSLVSE
ncbi:hypothetical protein T03_1643 [Trichinella britovi]|uniref:Uncharacterized protein n=1 Tax=Trichinella britovi TaxID=45882 RepID=A0A0V1C4W7_TRIBR|nr:hypothetical protein T03_1643 [Trichinella britovi]